MTGRRYVESLRDGREVWIDGERVDDVTTHPAFKDMIAELAPTELVPQLAIAALALEIFGRARP